METVLTSLTTLHLYFQANRDYHLSAYAYTNADSTGSGSAYTYPHPLRDDLTPPVTTGTGKKI